MRDCHKLGLVIHGDFILGLPGETRESIRNTIEFAKQLDCETIQVSIAATCSTGTEFFDYAKENGFITNEAMSGDGGHRMAHIEYPGLPVEYVMEMVHQFLRPGTRFRPTRARPPSSGRPSAITTCPVSMPRPSPSPKLGYSATSPSAPCEEAQHDQGAEVRRYERGGK